MQNRNGHNLGITDPDYSPEGFSPARFRSISKDFIEPGDDVNKLIMRCRLLDDRQKNAAVLYLKRCREFHMVEHEKLLITWLAASDSIHARRINLLANTYVGANSKKNSRGGFFGNLLGGGDESDRKDGDGE